MGRRQASFVRTNWRAVLLTGRGGQGVQLCGKVLAEAAALDGQHVLLNSYFGGEMRGGRTESTVVMGADPIEHLPPVVPQVQTVLVLDSAYLGPVIGRMAPDAMVIAEQDAVDDGDLDAELLRVPAREMATGLGAEVAMGLVLVGLFARHEGSPRPESLEAAVRALVPAHRVQALETDLAALAAGARLCEELGLAGARR